MRTNRFATTTEPPPGTQSSPAKKRNTPNQSYASSKTSSPLESGKRTRERRSIEAHEQLSARVKPEKQIYGQWRPRENRDSRFYSGKEPEPQKAAPSAQGTRAKEHIPAKSRRAATQYKSQETQSNRAAAEKLSDTRITDLIGQLKAASQTNGSDNRINRAAELDQRTATISVRLNEVEFSKLKHRAAESGISISAYMRSCVLEAEQLRAEVKQALAEMRAATGRSNSGQLDERSPYDAPKAAWTLRLKQLAGLLMAPLFLSRHRV